MRKEMLMTGTVVGHRLGRSRQYRDTFGGGHCSVWGGVKPVEEIMPVRIMRDWLE